MPPPYKTRACLWLIAVFGVLAAGHFLFFRFSFHEMNPYPISRGIAFGSTLWSTVLLVAMAMRLGWARYVLSIWLVGAIMAIGMIVLLMNKHSAIPLEGPTQDALIGMGLYALALVPLGISRSLRRFLGPRTAGGA